MELSDLNGVGKIRLEALHAAGIYSLRDLLYSVPEKYRDVSRTVDVSQAEPGMRQGFRLLRQGEAKLARFKGNMTRVTCAFTDDSGMLEGCWFNQPWMRETLNKGTRFLLFGLVEMRGGRKQLTNPSVESEERIVPLYRPIEGVPQKTHETIVRQALESVDQVCEETLPLSLLERYSLWPRVRAIQCLHAPRSMEEVALAQRRFAFEQMLLYQASARSMSDLRSQGIPVPSTRATLQTYWASLPFTPTEAQRRTLEEIARDMAGEKSMARMVQGDVGSGKTAVAMGAMLLCAQAGYQSALMAPTEILARQHYESMRAYYQKQGITVGLLIGGMPVKERRQALDAIANAQWQIVIGTHALIGKSVRFSRLALCVTDEQHRFGVAQRTSLLNKSTNDAASRKAHVLVMSATPIPRSLALVLFGDLDVSVIDQLPPGRMPVKTRLVPEDKRKAMYGFLRKEMQTGRQAYIVCPLVEESENADGLKVAKAHWEELKKGALRGFRVGLTYGSQPSEEKRETLRAFAAGEIQALVSTTVIEVGVNVPNATVMVIEDADRYGLAQLHQLRGRVGRGGAQSWCFLLAKPNERLLALVNTNDGFAIAQADLEQRGPGELLGTRQHGPSLLPGGAAAFGSMPLIYEAAACVEELSTDPARREEWSVVRELSKELLHSMGDKVSAS